METPQDQESPHQTSNSVAGGSQPSEHNSLAEPINQGQSSTPIPESLVPSSGENQQPNEPEDLDTSKLKSNVWDHMKKRRIEGKLKAVCNYCNTKLAAEQSSGTRHLHAHIDSCLRKRKNSYPQAFQKLLIANKKSDGKTTISNYTFDQQGSRNDLVEMIIMHEHPLSIVDQAGFQKFVKNLQPLFKVPSRNTVRADVLKLYINRMKATMSLMESNKGRVAITTDMWTADNQKKSYMAVTAHFIDDSWHLKQRLLRFQYVPSPHTIDVLAEYLMNVLLDWNLDAKLSTITVDNCSVNDGVVASLVHKLDNEQLLLNGSVLHMRCCAHILNLIVKDGLDIIGPSLEKIRDSCVFWSSTPKKIEKFEETARQLRITSNKKLCYDVKTRWNSTYLMLETAIVYKDVFFRLKLRDAQYKNVPSEEDWENAKIIFEKLKIFFTTTELFSGTKYTTANRYFNKICEIRLAISKWMSDSNPTIASMASRMMDKFMKYWGVIHGVMGIASLLDPRCKMDLLDYYYEKIYGVGYAVEVEKIVELCRQMFREYQRRGPKNQDDEPAGVENDTSEFPEDFLQKKKRRRVDSGSTELTRYLDEELAPVTENFNVLNWWMTNGPKFPTLQRIAQDIYAIPVSTVASESAFSMGGRIISPQRNRLKPKLVEALACAQNWLRAELEEFGDNNPFKSYCDEEDDDEDQDATSMFDELSSACNLCSEE